MSDSDMHVGVFISHMAGGGAQRAMLNLAKGMSYAGCRVDLVLARAEGPLLPEARAAVNVIDLGASRVLRALPDLVRYLRRERPYALVSAMEYVNVVALWGKLLSRSRTRFVVSEQNTLTQQVGRARRRGWIMPTLVRHFYPQADRIVPNSQGVMEDLMRVTGLSQDRFSKIYNPMITAGMRAQSRLPVEHPWLEDRSVPVVLAVGRLEEQKDYPTLVRAFAKVRANRPARLVILGEGSKRPELEALIRTLGVDEDTDLPGFAANPYAFMANAACFVLSSRWEGLPGVLVEALACETPLVATDCPSGPMEILEGGRFGRLVPVGDAEGLSDAIGQALDGEVPPPPEESWLRFEVGRVTDQYLELLRSL